MRAGYITEREIGVHDLDAIPLPPVFSAKIGPSGRNRREITGQGRQDFVMPRRGNAARASAGLARTLEFGRLDGHADLGPVEHFVEPGIP